MIWILKNRDGTYLAATAFTKFPHVTLGDCVREQPYACRYDDYNEAARTAVRVGYEQWRIVRLRPRTIPSTKDESKDEDESPHTGKPVHLHLSLFDTAHGFAPCGVNTDGTLDPTRIDFDPSTSIAADVTCLTCRKRLRVLRENLEGLPW